MYIVLSRADVFKLDDSLVAAVPNRIVFNIHVLVRFVSGRIVGLEYGPLVVRGHIDRSILARQMLNPSTCNYRRLCKGNTPLFVQAKHVT